MTPTKILDTIDSVKVAVEKFTDAKRRAKKSPAYLHDIKTNLGPMLAMLHWNAAANRKSSLTISAKPVGVGAASQPWIPAGEQSLLLMRIATTGSVSLCVRMRS